MKEKHYRIIKPYIKPILIWMAAISIILITKPPIYILLAALSLMTIWQNKKEPKKIPKELLRNNLTLTIIWGTYKLIGGKGIGIIILTTIILSLWILWKRRKTYMKTIREIEIIIWGKTNDRQNNRENK